MPASDKNLFDQFSLLGIEVTTVTHTPMLTVEDGKEMFADLPGGHCKSLFLKEKKGSLWLVVMLNNIRLDINKLQKKLGSSRLSFAKPDLMKEILGVEPGSVTPFALLNKTASEIKVVLDKKMMEEELLNYHPLRNDATTTIKTSDLLKFIHAMNHRPIILEM